MKVLIVDENPTDLRLQAELLANQGFTVMHARSAVDGMKSITTDNPDLIVADVVPDFPGYDDPSALLRAMVCIYDLPMIAVSHGARSSSPGDPLGCIGQIAKPIDTRTYADEILKLWEARPQVWHPSTFEPTPSATQGGR